MISRNANILSKYEIFRTKWLQEEGRNEFHWKKQNNSLEMDTIFKLSTIC